VDLTDAAGRKAAADLVQVRAHLTVTAFYLCMYVKNSFSTWQGACLAVTGHRTQHACSAAQGLLVDGEGAPARDPALAAALMRLAAQVHAAPAELAAALLDAIAACMQLGKGEQDAGDDSPSIFFL
jgi:hypothetical protein